MADFFKSEILTLKFLVQRYQHNSFIFVVYSFLFYMSFLDIVLGSLLVFGFYKGFKNGIFIEVASLISLILGIYIAIKFSILTAEIISGFLHWNPKTIQITAFILTFILVVFGVYLFAKFLTG